MRGRMIRLEGDGLRTMTREEAGSCVGGTDWLKGMFDWILGNPPDPNRWPPEKL